MTLTFVIVFVMLLISAMELTWISKIQGVT